MRKLGLMILLAVAAVVGWCAAAETNAAAEVAVSLAAGSATLATKDYVDSVADSLRRIISGGGSLADRMPRSVSAPLSIDGEDGILMLSICPATNIAVRAWESSIPSITNGTVWVRVSAESNLWVYVNNTLPEHSRLVRRTDVPARQVVNGVTNRTVMS